MLTPLERAVLETLVEAHNCFVKLPEQHPADVTEWAFHLHALQNLVASRSGFREINSGVSLKQSSGGPKTWGCAC